MSAFELVAGDACAVVAACGAEALQWRVAGRDLLWRRETTHWNAVAPLLFPCVGWSRGGVVRIAGATYPMPVHGFAAGSLFQVVRQDADVLELELCDTPASRAHYPFAFRLRVRYALTPTALRVEVDVHNPGVDPMPFALGVHPGFAWPFAGGAPDAYHVAFEEAESPRIPMITVEGLFGERSREAPLRAGVLPLHPALFAKEALCFLHARSKALRFVAPSGQCIEARAEGFRHWALWSRPGAPFVCLEAWTGHGDPDGFAGEFADKPSIDVLAPGHSRAFALTWAYEER